MGLPGDVAGGDPTTAQADNIAGFAVPSSHNAFLEIALQLGLTGLSVVCVLLVVALRRGARCFVSGQSTLGWFSMMFVVGSVMAGLTTETLGQNQVIEWVVFNALLFSCGMCAQQVRAGAPATVGRKTEEGQISVGRPCVACGS